ncbi:MAG: hypothetical protein QXP72_05865 [Desulfurococcaceae archaeon]
MKLLEIKPLEPLSLTLSPISGIDIFTTTHSTPIPLPTSVAGAIGSSMNIELFSNDPVESLIELINRLKELCGNMDEPIIQGPLTCFEEQIMDPSKCYAYIYGNKLISLSFSGFEVRNKMVYLREKCKDHVDCFVNFTPITMIGVSLQRTKPGEDKIVRYGYMYRYPLITFRTSSGRVVNPIYLYRFNCRKDLNVINRFGGESRVAKFVTIDVEADFLNNIKTPLKKLERGLYISLSPIPIIPLKDNVLRLEPDAVELPVPLSSVVGLPQEKSHPKLRIVRLGLGFSEVVRKKRPEILALPPGTIIGVEDDVNPPTFGDNDLMKELLHIGFATLYKLSG